MVRFTQNFCRKRNAYIIYVFLSIYLYKWTKSCSLKHLILVECTMTMSEPLTCALSQNIGILRTNLSDSKNAYITILHTYIYIYIYAYLYMYTMYICVCNIGKIKRYFFASLSSQNVNILRASLCLVIRINAYKINIFCSFSVH